MVWTLDLVALSGLGAPLVSDADLHSLSVTWSVDGPGSFEADFGADTAASWLAGQRRVRVNLTAVRKWQGWLDQVTEDTNSWNDLETPGGVPLRASGLGHAGRLLRRIFHGDTPLTGTGPSVAWQMIQHAQAQSNGDYGFTLGTITGTGPTRTRTYCDGENIADAINELAARDVGGFDWEITEAGVFNAWVGRRGTDRSGTITLIRGDTMTWSVDYDTSDLVTYANAMYEVDGPCADVVTRSSGLETTYGRLESVVDSPNNDSAQMTELADEDLHALGSARLRVHATWPENDAPWAWGTVWLGDTISVVVPSHFGGTQDMRVIEIKVSVEPPALAYIEYELELP